MTTPGTPYSDRLARVRHALHAAGVEAMLVTHLPNVRYLTGFTGSAGLAVVTPAECRLLVDFRYVTAAQELADSRGGRDIALHIVESTYDAAALALLQQMRMRRVGIEAAWMPVNRFNRLSKGLAAGAARPLDAPNGCPVLVPLERIVESSRAVKDPAEIATLREAARRLSAVALETPALAVAGRTEREVAWDIEQALRRAGFERPAFETIVAAGPNGALPHARPTSRILARGESVVLDFGGVYDGYCVDLTRTVRLGEQSPELRRLFDAVREAHAAAVGAVRPGALPSEIDGAARGVLERHGLGDAFGHGTGHGLGLEVHEEPRIARKVEGQDDSPVQAGMVFTIEPGAYVPGVGGVRIEDDVLVTGTGCELLTDVPVELNGA